MLEQIMREIRNFFPYKDYSGTFTISSGILSPAVTGKYYLIEGSLYNNGVHESTDELTDETFEGSVVVLAPPASFLELVSEIEAYEAKNGAISPYTSESFGGYSYSKPTAASGAAATWSDVFRSRLNAWRKV